MRLRHSILGLLAAGVFALGCRPDVAATFRGDDGRSGEHRVVWVGALDEIVWKQRFDHAIGGAPAVGHEALYTTHAGGALAALSLRDGMLLWETPIDAPSFGTPVATARRILVGTDRGLVAVDPDGVLLWKYQTEPIEVAPLVLNGVAYVGTRGGRILAIDEVVGSLIWESIVAGPVVAPGVVSGADVVFGANDGGVYALSPTSGEARWTWRAAAPIRGVAARNGRVVVTTGTEIVAIAANDPETPQWRVDVGDRVTTPPSFSGSLVVVGTGGGQLVAVDQNDGTPTFKRIAGPAIRGDIHTVGGAIVVPLGTDGVAVLDGSGKIDWTFRTDDVVRGVALTDDRLLITDTAGSVYAIR